MKPEKEILIVNWDYKREDLTRHLYKLSDHYELYFLYYYAETSHENRFKVLNWNDFSSAQKLIDTIKPKKIIFHDIESFHQIALNVVAAKNGIETIVLEHGLRRGSEVQIEYKKTSDKVALTQSSFKTFLFLFYSMFALQPKFYLDLIKLVYYRKKYGLTVGLHKAQYPFRWAKVYINFTELNASYIRERDAVTSDRFIFTGNAQFDEYFLKAKSFEQIKKEPIIVLFDTPFEDDNTFNMPAEVKIEFYKKLNSYCKKENKKLVVKLHPRSYKRNYNVEDISFVTDVDPAELIFKASGCAFLHLSGLLPFAALYNRVILFNTYPEYNTELTDSSLVNVFDFYGSDINAIVFKDIDPETKNTIIKNYFYKTDGKAGERILETISSVDPN